MARVRNGCVAMILIFCVAGVAAVGANLADLGEDTRLMAEDMDAEHGRKMLGALKTKIGIDTTSSSSSDSDDSDLEAPQPEVDLSIAFVELIEAIEVFEGSPAPRPEAITPAAALGGRKLRALLRKVGDSTNDESDTSDKSDTSDGSDDSDIEAPQRDVVTPAAALAGRKLHALLPKVGNSTSDDSDGSDDSDIEGPTPALDSEPATISVTPDVPAGTPVAGRKLQQVATSGNSASEDMLGPSPSPDSEVIDSEDLASGNGASGTPGAPGASGGSGTPGTPSTPGGAGEALLGQGRKLLHDGAHEGYDYEISVPEAEEGAR